MDTMEREIFKAGNMLYPVPAVMLSMLDESNNKANIITVAWTGTICSDPAMLYVSIRPSRYSYNIIKESKEFVVNICGKNLVKELDFAGVKSGKNIDKFEYLSLTKGASSKVKAPYIKEAVIAIECKLKDIIKLGSHDMFIANVVSVHVDKKYIDQKGKFNLTEAEPIVYSHGEYFSLGDVLGKFGFSVRKNKKKY